MNNENMQRVVVADAGFRWRACIIRVMNACNRYLQGGYAIDQVDVVHGWLRIVFVVSMSRPMPEVEEEAE